ncbi:MAG: helix-turn-helix transcriptional regulator [Bacilli bacterium]|nr:helix-turn-helix transcriptional regulator [Bacilli bacterium]
MEKDLKEIVGKNLASLRKKKQLTQIELAHIFNYSDKAVSKWELGATLPDIETLKNLCDYYGVTLDYLTKEENIEDPSVIEKEKQKSFLNKIIMVLLLDSMIWIVATISFAYPLLILNQKIGFWPSFIWALPVSAILVFLCNKKFFNNRLTYVISGSLFVWTLLLAVYLQMIYMNHGNLWLLFIIGVPIQITILLYYFNKTIK